MPPPPGVSRCRRAPSFSSLTNPHARSSSAQCAQRCSVARYPGASRPGIAALERGRAIIPRMRKVISGEDEAVALIPDGATIMVGGFGLCGIPENLIGALRRRGTRNLTIISNNAGIDGFGLGVLLESRQISRIVATYVGENQEFERQYLSRELDVELVPQGTFAERIRAGGAGIGGFFTPAGYGTIVADGKETRVIDGVPYVLEMPLRADFALLKAYKGDHAGNLVYRKTARNFSPMMATAARVTIVEVEHLVEPGGIDADGVHTPGIFVRHLFQGTGYQKRIERRTTRKA